MVSSKYNLYIYTFTYCIKEKKEKYVLHEQQYWQRMDGSG